MPLTQGAPALARRAEQGELAEWLGQAQDELSRGRLRRASPGVAGRLVLNMGVSIALLAEFHPFATLRTLIQNSILPAPRVSDIRRLRTRFRASCLRARNTLRVSFRAGASNQTQHQDRTKYIF